MKPGGWGVDFASQRCAPWSRWRRCGGSLVLLSFFLFFPDFLEAGGPANVAGVSWFQPATTGSPILWAGGTVTYYTDRGDLSVYLKEADADRVVAYASSKWTAIPTVALIATRGGQLDEDVNGSNVISNGGQIIMPADIQHEFQQACGNRL